MRVGQNSCHNFIKILEFAFHLQKLTWLGFEHKGQDHMKYHYLMTRERKTCRVKKN